MKKKRIHEFVHGNYFNKYSTKNPLYLFLMRGFFKAFHKLLDTYSAEVNTICEVGCGEGEILRILHKKYPSADLFACDISAEEIKKARENNKNANIHFSVQDAENLSGYIDEQFDLVICCEVLEHLPNPERGLNELERITRKNLLISVPNEPIWRLLNMLRGKYLNHFGNTPGHLNHWNMFSFSRFTTQPKKFITGRNQYPFPWQMKLLQRKQTGGE